MRPRCPIVQHYRQAATVIWCGVGGDCPRRPCSAPRLLGQGQAGICFHKLGFSITVTRTKVPEHNLGPSTQAAGPYRQVGRYGYPSRRYVPCDGANCKTAPQSSRSLGPLSWATELLHTGTSCLGCPSAAGAPPGYPGSMRAVQCKRWRGKSLPALLHHSCPVVLW